MTIKNNNLIAATQGRSIWIIDDLTPLHQLNNSNHNNDFHLFKPIDSYRMGYPSWGGSSSTQGKNHHNGVEVFFNIDKKLVDDNSDISLEFLDENQNMIKKYSLNNKKSPLKLDGEKNSFVWNMRYDNAEGFDGLIMWAAGLTGPKAYPGTYYVKLNVGESSMIESFNILKDERSLSSNEDLKEQFDFLIGIRDKVTEIHKSIKQIRSTRDQLNSLNGKLDDSHESISNSIKDIIKRITKIEENLYQTKNRSGQDPLNFPIRLNNKLAHLSSVAGRGNFKPTDQMYGVRDELVKLIDVELQKWNEIKDSELDKINAMILENNIQLISIN